MNQIDWSNEKAGMRSFAARIGLIYLIMWPILVLMHQLLRHSHLDTMLTTVACWMCLPAVRLLLDASARARWAGCGVICLMICVLATTLLPFGLRFEDAVQAVVGGSTSVVIIVWLSTYLLRIKARQQRRF